MTLPCHQTVIILPNNVFAFIFCQILHIYSINKATISVSLLSLCCMLNTGRLWDFFVHWLFVCLFLSFSHSAIKDSEGDTHIP